MNMRLQKIHKLRIITYLKREWSQLDNAKKSVVE
jgi:hypothetical protein